MSKSWHDVAVFPGAMTPTKVVAARKTRCNFVKVFPCEQVGGEQFIRTLNTALPQIPLIAAGGVNLKNAAHYIMAGAGALGIGNSVWPKPWRRWLWLACTFEFANVESDHRRGI